MPLFLSPHFAGARGAGPGEAGVAGAGGAGVAGAGGAGGAGVAGAGGAGKRKLQRRRGLQKRSLGSGKREVGGNKWRGMD